MKISNIWKFIIAIAISEFAGIVGAIFTTPAIPNWYATLPRPSFTPQSWVFGPVWTTLFFLMGIAAFLVWRKGLEQKKVQIALFIFGIQLALNTLWSIIFFGLQNPGGAFLEIIILWLAILATMIMFARVSSAAAWLLLPYILWVSFAGFLNYAIWQMPVAASNTVFCTQEAKQCPDGSYVGRTGPKCEFGACPATTRPAGWQTLTSTSTGISFSYPKQLSTKYIHAQDWPPQVMRSDRSVACAPGGMQILPGGETVERTVNNHMYCITTKIEGAAGSMYSQYAYQIVKDNGVTTLMFTLRSVQCANYDDPQKTACETERSTFDAGVLADQMMQSVSLK